MRKKGKIALAIVASILIISVFFMGGLWIGVYNTDIRGFFTGTGNNAQETVEDKAEEDKNLIDNISDTIKGTLSIKPVEETIELVSSDALESISREELIIAAIEGILSKLDDDHSDYFTQDEYEKVIDSYNGTMSGVGIIVTMDEEDRVVVVKPIEGAPASRAGIQEGDIIIKVDGMDIKGKSLEEVIALIKGEEGTEVDLTVEREKDDEIIDFHIERERFYVPNIFSEIIEDNIAYIQYSEFQQKGAKRLEEETDSLIEEGAEGIILDLRNNLGGALDDAINVCDLFLEEGIITSIKGRTNNNLRSEEYNANGGKYKDVPLVVLVNEFSASAAELVAGCLKDNERAILVGENTYGKGTVQVLNGLSDGSGIKFTTAKFFLPSGESINGAGIVPDIEIEFDPDADTDVQLEGAIEELKTIMENTGNESMEDTDNSSK